MVFLASVLRQCHALLDTVSLRCCPPRPPLPSHSSSSSSSSSHPSVGTAPRLTNHPYPHPRAVDAAMSAHAVDTFLQGRHERAMIRLCALLWILKLEEDRVLHAQEKSACGCPHHQHQHQQQEHQQREDQQEQQHLQEQQQPLQRDQLRHLVPCCLHRDVGDDGFAVVLYDKINTRSHSPSHGPVADAVYHAKEV
ncbi:hypothetical protein ACOMHN_051144 [Nucella lapillus]